MDRRGFLFSLFASGVLASTEAFSLFNVGKSRHEIFSRDPSLERLRDISHSMLEGLRRDGLADSEYSVLKFYLEAFEEAYINGDFKKLYIVYLMDLMVRYRVKPSCHILFPGALESKKPT